MKPRFVSAMVLSLALAAAACAQDATPAPPNGPADGQGRRDGRGGWGGMMPGGARGVLGTVTETAADRFTVKTDRARPTPSTSARTRAS